MIMLSVALVAFLCGACVVAIASIMNCIKRLILGTWHFGIQDIAEALKVIAVMSFLFAAITVSN